MIQDMTMTRLAPLALALVALAGPAAAADTILPGYWESTNRMLSRPSARQMWKSVA